AFGQLRVTVEVRRLRVPTPSAAQLARTVCDKLGQLPPGTINVLVLGAEAPLLAAASLIEATGWLELRAATNDDPVFRQRGFSGARDFLRHYRRLSGVLLFAESGGPTVDLWKNPQGRHPLPAALATILGRLALLPTASD
ncbi:MAG: hypothetical protein QOE13_3355, partial [Gaiellaceae bacterium]|nr:hypothetical protein [Gaiellaceae bacterium]